MFRVGFCCLFLGAFLGLPAFAAAPVVQSQTPVGVTMTSAVMRASVLPFGKPTTAWFVWGATTNYGNVTSPVSLPGASSFLSITSLLAGLSPGATVHYRAVAFNMDGPASGNDVSFTTEALPEPAWFQEVSQNLEGSFAGHAAFADYDADGRMDLLLIGTTNVFSNGSFTRLYDNTGAGFDPVALGLPGLIQGSVAWVDFDRDGHSDFFIVGRQTNAAPFSALMRNLAGTGFSNTFAAIPGAQDTAVAWGDYDNDGDQDLFFAGEPSANQFVARIYVNGAGGFQGVDVLRGFQNGGAAWGDYDNDGDLDLAFAGTTTNGSLGNANLIAGLYRNEGGRLTNSGIALPGMAAESIAWFDFDNDGDLDLLMNGATNTLSGSLTNFVALLYRNDSALFVRVQTGFENSDLGTALWGDFNVDGRSDVLLTGRFGVGENPARMFLNGGNGTFTWSTNTGLPQVFTGGGALADVEDDGRLDVLLTGAASGFNGVTRLFQNLISATNTPPVAPEGLMVELEADGRSAILRWNPTTDVQTPSAGLTYNVRLGTTPGGVNIISPEADLTTGRRLVVEMGNAQHRRSLRVTGLLPGATYYWSVQAVDNGFAGSPFAPEQSFATVGPANATRVTRLGNAVVITFSGTPFATYRVQAAIELVQPPAQIQWSQVAVRTASDTGTFEFSVNSVGMAQSFYRAVYP